MKAIVIEHRGDPGSLKEFPEPSFAANEILVRVTAAGVNPMDWKVRDQGDRPLPFVLGQDFAGVVSDAGGNVSKYRKGERVFGIARSHGAYAEYTVVPENDRVQPIAKIPDDVGDADAAALPTAGLTALAAMDALAVAKGTTLLVMGATGGVGGFAVQMAHDRGAFVIGTASDSNESLARGLGVDEFVAYNRDKVNESVKSAHPAGVDAVLDLVDDAAAMKQIAEVVREGGRVASTIGSADVDWFAQRKIVAINLSMPRSAESSHAGLRALLELLEQGRLRVLISSERPLAEAADALAASEAGTIDGKLVLTVD